MKIKDIIEAIWCEAWVMIGNDKGTVWQGYAGDIPVEYMEKKFECLVPMVDGGTPAIGIELK